MAAAAIVTTLSQPEMITNGPTAELDEQDASVLRTAPNAPAA